MTVDNFSELMTLSDLRERGDEVLRGLASRHGASNVRARVRSPVLAEAQPR